MTSDRTAMERIMVGHHQKFLSFLEKRIQNHADAEEILQTAFARGLEKAPETEDEERITAWFYRVLKNAVVDHYRHRAAEGRAMVREAEQALIALGGEPELESLVCQCMHDILPSVKPEFRDALERIDLDEGSIADFARDHDLTPNNARVRLHRARQAMRRELERTCGACAEHACLECSCSRQNEEASR